MEPDPSQEIPESAKLRLADDQTEKVKNELCADKSFPGKNLVPTVNHRGRNVVFWGCFAALWSEELALTDSTAISASHRT